MILSGKAVVGHVRKRVGPNGVRWAALYYDARERQRSAGSFATKREAELAWQSAEARMRGGSQSDSAARSLRFDTYVDEQWFPNHILEPATRESYRYCLDRHIIPWFGPMKIRDILPAHVREWVTALCERGVSPAQVRHLRIILSAVFTTALNDFVVLLHPCKGVKTPTVPVREYRIVTPGEYEALLRAMPNEAAKLLLELAIGSGLRWGELTELRPRDLDTVSGILTVTRAVSEVGPKGGNAGERFRVKPYPKNRRSRRLKLDPELCGALLSFAAAKGIGPEDLLFGYELFTPAPRPVLRSVEALGMTSPNDAGRSYRHGTMSAYAAGKCRCESCRSAFATYRARRRAAGLDCPRPLRVRDTDGHLPRDWYRHRIWIPACEQAGLRPRPRLHDLRHSHASWLLAGGADLQVVKERLGHRSIATTGRYLHTLPTADESALRALRRIRSPT